MNQVDTLREWIKQCNNIVFFGGAGVSTESGIPDFRSANGLYKINNNQSLPAEEMLSHSFYMKHTNDFYKFYKENMVYENAMPNKAHYALVELEKKNKLKAIITQNIDGLHQMAGSKVVYELHGSIHRNYCQKCGKFFDLRCVMSQEHIPHCDRCQGVIKPDVVLYEESLDQEVIYNAVKSIQQADMLMIGGTSLAVQPAASLITYFSGKYLVLINKSDTPYDRHANLVINNSVGEVLHKVV